MTVLVFVLLVGGPGVLPAAVALRRSPAVALFLAPLVGAMLAAVAAELELAVGGELLCWYVPLAVAVNAAAMATAYRARRRRWRPPVGWGWSAAVVVVVGAALVLPLRATAAPMIGYDANSIWITHALMALGGHGAFRAGLLNPAYRFSNPDYPPLVPAVSALLFRILGTGELHRAVVATVALNASAAGVLAAGVASVGLRGGRLTRAVAIVAGAAVAVVAFAVAGRVGLDGHADLLWAVAAAAAVVWGLVLPESATALRTAWIAAAVAGLTKDEGFTSAMIVLTLVALRYSGVLDFAAGGGRRPSSARLGRACGLFAVPAALPVAWVAITAALGIGNGFFHEEPGQGFPSGTGESVGYRFHATVTAFTPHLEVLPVALAVAVLGVLVLRRRSRDRVEAHPVWLWVAFVAATAVIAATYVVGDYAVVLWLDASVSRTTIFSQVVLYAELAVWLVVAVDGSSRQESSGRKSGAPPGSES